jgi:cysteine desulfurase/selenocysteine lyase
MDPLLSNLQREGCLTLSDYRRAFPDFSPTIYLNCAYQGPFPLKTVESIRLATELKCHPERLESRDYFELPERVRSRLARLTNADPGEIALTNSATQGIGIIATGLEFKPGDEVIVASCNFPSNLFTWLHLRRRGVRVNVVHPRDGCVRAEDVAAVLTARTRVLALDWVDYSTGARIDLAEFGELAHRHDALFVVDGTQGVGGLELNLHELPVDAVAVAAYKWLLGPYGAGFVYLNWNTQDLLDLQVINWFAVEGSEDFDNLPVDKITLPKAARVFDIPETANFLNLYALDSSLEFVECVRVSAVQGHCTRLLDCLMEGLGGRGYRFSAAAEPSHRSTILGFQAQSLEATERLYAELEAHHIAVSLRHGMIRVSPYVYNDVADIQKLLRLAIDR